MVVTLTAQAEALFVSFLQPSSQASPAQVKAAIAASLAAFHGTTGCAAAMAAEYGKDPELASARMRWALAQCRTTGRSNH
ncbi:MAG: hypothetical protein H0T78_12970 [Longispora sp.]|nr:hypothetical protein [Longispora sp. (in: high G+C Gram-positive bacteria)]